MNLWNPPESSQPPAPSQTVFRTSGLSLRDYQQQGVDGVFQEFFESGRQSTLVVMPTGTGKTVLFGHVIRRWEKGRVMVIAHREELIRQAANKIAAVTGIKPEIEMAEERADEHFYAKAKVVVASKDTLHEKRLQRFDPGEFGLVITDEAHHAVADSYRRIYEHFKNCHHLGVTATPDRTDEAALGKVFQSVAFNYEIQDAINDGWLVPIVQQSVSVADLDYSKVRTTAGDLNGADLANLMEEEKVLHEFASPTLELAGKRKTLVFATTVKHAERLCEIFNRHSAGCARWVSAATPRDERAQMLADYREGLFQYLVNVGVFTEGFDEPSIELIVMARPTKSRSLFAQMVGRGTRPLPGVVDGFSDEECAASGVTAAQARREAIRQSSKPNVEILDFVGNTGKHKLITVADILGGNYDDDVVEAAAKKAREAGKPVDVAAALEQAKRELHERREREKERRRQVIGTATYSTKQVDPFDVLDIDPWRERGWDVGKEPSEKMVAFLAKNGIDAAGLSFGRCKQLIGEIISRRNRDLCSFKQAKILAKYGYKTDCTFQEARQIIDQIAANNWRKPPGDPVARPSGQWGQIPPPPPEMPPEIPPPPPEEVAAA